VTTLGAWADPLISPSTPTSTVPTYLADGSSWFGITVPDPPRSPSPCSSPSSWAPWSSARS